jgi:hypothetical protein
MSINITTNKEESPAGNEVNRDDVARRAYQIWEAAGQPAGRDLEYWLQAEAELQSARHSRSPKATVSGDGPRHESAGASASLQRAPRVEKPEPPRTNSLLTGGLEEAHGRRLANTGTRPDAPSMRPRPASRT